MLLPPPLLLGLVTVAPPFFDTDGRLQRGVTPTPEAPKLYAPVFQGKSLVKQTAAGGWAPALLTENAVGGEEIFLGAVADTEDYESSLAPGEYWLLEMSKTGESAPEMQFGAVWEPLRAKAGPSICDALHSDEAALLATAAGMANWHDSIRYCANCGSGEIELYRNGKGRRCTSCGTRFRPRIEPSIIVLVVDEA